jgi:membrane protein required for beta-lactamase induction
MNQESQTHMVAVDHRWWRMPIWWLVIGGPLTVVVAGLTTAVIAVRGADVVVPPDAPDAGRAALPAREGRNLANTPPSPRPAGTAPAP